MDALLTEANWKSKGLPLRSLKEKVGQSKTGISEALRALALADKALKAELLNASIVKKMDTALKTTEATLKKLKAEDKKLVKLRDDMVKAIDGYRNTHNNLVNQINRGNIGGLPGGIKMLQKQAEKEFSPENQQFMEGAMKVSSDALKIMAYVENFGADKLNISNEGQWKKLAADFANWEKQVKLALKTSLTDIAKNQNDTIDRLKRECFL